jgi:glyoxylase-like metal-dependent hydrolase (beta-lactamase superfamily II)
MEQSIDLTRRSFLIHAGRGTVALAVLGVAGCAPGGSSPVTTTAGASSPAASEAAGSVEWQRVDLDFVSAFILARAGEAAVVDTGVVGSEGAIEAGLAELGLGWDAVAHLIVTHHHPDHAGSVEAVLAAASDAAGYAGASDIPRIISSRPLTAVGDGDRVFDLAIVTTPGHTAGHISVHDAGSGVLVAGDALVTEGGTLAGSDPRYTDDTEQARASVAKLGGLRFETLLVGHGEPILAGASAQVAALAASS